MIYEVKFTKGARKMFRKLSQELQDRIQPKIDELAIEPGYRRTSGVAHNRVREWADSLGVL